MCVHVLCHVVSMLLLEHWLRCGVCVCVCVCAYAFIYLIDGTRNQTADVTLRAENVRKRAAEWGRRLNRSETILANVFFRGIQANELLYRHARMSNKEDILVATMHAHSPHIHIYIKQACTRKSPRKRYCPRRRGRARRKPDWRWCISRSSLYLGTCVCW